MDVEVASPVLKGSFAIYNTPDGGMVIAYRPDGTEETSHIPIPAVMMKMYQRVQNGESISPMQMFRAAFSSSG